MITTFLDCLATQRRTTKLAAAIQRILDVYEDGDASQPEAESNFRNFVEKEQACK